MKTLLVNKTDFGDVTVVNYDEGDLPDGQIRVDGHSGGSRDLRIFPNR